MRHLGIADALNQRQRVVGGQIIAHLGIVLLVRHTAVGRSGGRGSRRALCAARTARVT